MGLGGVIRSMSLAAGITAGMVGFSYSQDHHNFSPNEVRRATKLLAIERLHREKVLGSLANLVVENSCFSKFKQEGSKVEIIYFAFPGKSKTPIFLRDVEGDGITNDDLLGINIGFVGTQEYKLSDVKKLPSSILESMDIISYTFSKAVGNYEGCIKVTKEMKDKGINFNLGNYFRRSRKGVVF